MSNEVAEVLTKARSILQDMGWTKHSLARDDKNLMTAVDSVDAVCFCSLGAICRAIGGRDIESPTPLERAVKIQLSKTMNADIVETNDDNDTRLIHVLMAFDFAILMAEETA